MDIIMRSQSAKEEVNDLNKLNKSGDDGASMNMQETTNQSYIATEAL